MPNSEQSMQDEKLFLLESTIIKLEAERENLLAENRKLRSVNETLQAAILDSADDKQYTTIHKKINRSMDVHLRLLFYHEHKNDVAVVKKLEEKQRLLGMHYIPWHWKKRETDKIWNDWIQKEGLKPMDANTSGLNPQGLLGCSGGGGGGPWLAPAKGPIPYCANTSGEAVQDEKP